MQRRVLASLAKTRDGPTGGWWLPGWQLQPEAGGVQSQRPPSRLQAGRGLKTAGRVRADANCRLPCWQWQAAEKQQAAQRLRNELQGQLAVRDCRRLVAAKVQLAAADCAA